MRKALPSFGFALALGWLLCGPQSSAAAENFVSPWLRFEERYDDNFRLQAKDEQDVWRTTIHPGFDFGYRRENLQLKGQAHLNILRYHGKSNLNKVEKLFDMDSRYNLERHQFGVKGKYHFRSTLRSEIANTGVTNIVLNRKDWEVNPYWITVLSEKDQLQLSYDFNSTDYQNNDVGLTDFTSQVAFLGLTHDLNKKVQLFGNVILSHFKSDLQNETDNYIEPQIGTLYRFTEQLEGSLTVGRIFTKSDFDTTDPTDCRRFEVVPGGGVRCTKFGTNSDNSTDSGFTAHLNLNYEQKRLKLRLQADRQLFPSGQGLFKQNSLQLNSTFQVTERLDIELRGWFRKNKSLNQDLGSVDRDFYQAAPGLHWRWAPTLNVGVAYQFRAAKDSGSDTAYSNAVLITLRYTPYPFTW